ncbi:hypothetical protein [Microbispora amethystogenes]|uniref:Uncharacterized protein n=1 Tax=Microbispora amethystogenes TaxID=1427754 RepID=A0ABQ4FJ57_9ACTN|nr:hypothetical protein [Microbispora amethystogenes]GIH34851.1 hypothetical protein Mam01_50150 [Microbispora amethystogenes]
MSFWDAAGRRWPIWGGLLIGALALGPALGPGFTLAYDLVFVPEPVFGATAFGLSGTLPRAVPSDALVAALGLVLPGALVQKAVLLGIFVLACCGMAALTERWPPTARVAAAVFYTWNPFVAERLLLGHWALLLGYAGLPWAVRAVSGGERRAGREAGREAGRGAERWSGRGAERRAIVLALLPAAAGGFMAMIITLVTAAPVAAYARTKACNRSRDRTLRVFAVSWVALSLPWLVPSLLRPGGVPGDPAGVDAFAARADTPFGALGSLLVLSGIWNAEAVPPGYDAMLPQVLRLAAAVVMLAGFALGRGAPARPGLAVAVVTGFAVAALGVTEPGRAALRVLVTHWAGFAVLRDAQQYVAPLALAQALGLGAVAARLRGAPARAVAGRAVAGGAVAGGAVTASAATASAVVASVVAAGAPLLLLPTLALGGMGRLAAVPYPQDFDEVRARVAADPVPGDVLLLPWEAYRAYDWNGRRSVLDPLPRYLPRRVVWNDAVRVGDSVGVGGGETVVGAEDPRVLALTPLVRSGAPLTEALRGAGFRFVVLDGDQSNWNAFHPRLRGARPVYTGRYAALYAIDAPATTPEQAPAGSPPAYAVILSWFVSLSYIYFMVRESGSSVVRRRSSGVDQTVE